MTREISPPEPRPDCPGCPECNGDVAESAKPKPPPQTDPEQLSYADAQSLVTLLAFGDRSKMQPADVRAYADAVSLLLSSVALMLPIGATDPILPALRDVLATHIHPRRHGDVVLVVDPLCHDAKKEISRIIIRNEFTALAADKGPDHA